MARQSALLSSAGPEFCSQVPLTEFKLQANMLGKPLEHSWQLPAPSACGSAGLVAGEAELLGGRPRFPS